MADKEKNQDAPNSNFVLSTFIMAKPLTEASSMDEFKKAITDTGQQIIANLLPSRIHHLSKLLNILSQLSNLPRTQMKSGGSDPRARITTKRQIGSLISSAHPRQSPTSFISTSSSSEASSPPSSLEDLDEEEGKEKLKTMIVDEAQDESDDQEVQSSAVSLSPGFSALQGEFIVTDEDGNIHAVFINKKVYDTMKEVLTWIEMATDDLDNLRLYVTQLADADPKTSDMAKALGYKMQDRNALLNEAFEDLQEDLDKTDVKEREDLTELDRRMLRYLRSACLMLIRTYLDMRINLTAIIGDETQKATLAIRLMIENSDSE